MDISLLSDQVSQQDAVEWAGLLTGIVYVLLATYERPSCWIFGILSSACIAWKSFTDYFLIADGILQVFYIIVGIVGIFQWVKGREEGNEKPIIAARWQIHFTAVGLCMLLSWPVSRVLITYAGARYGYPDTLLTLLSVWATLLLIRKDLYNWIYWIIIDAIYIGLYWQSKGYLFALLFLVYTAISVWGWRQWKNHFRLKGIAT